MAEGNFLSLKVVLLLAEEEIPSLIFLTCPANNTCFAWTSHDLWCRDVFHSHVHKFQHHVRARTQTHRDTKYPSSSVIVPLNRLSAALPLPDKRSML